MTPRLICYFSIVFQTAHGRHDAFKGQILHLQHIKYYLYGFVHDEMLCTYWRLFSCLYFLSFLFFFSRILCVSNNNRTTQNGACYVKLVLRIHEYISSHLYTHTHSYIYCKLYTSMPMSTPSQDRSVTLYFLLSPEKSNSVVQQVKRSVLWNACEPLTLPVTPS